MLFIFFLALFFSGCSSKIDHDFKEKKGWIEKIAEFEPLPDAHSTEEPEEKRAKEENEPIFSERGGGRDEERTKDFLLNETSGGSETTWLDPKSTDSEFCPQEQVLCDGVCINLLVDRENCGACSHSCPGFQLCVSGRCYPRCRGVFGLMCDHVCVSADIDPNHCGGCHRVCPPAFLCKDLVCVPCPLGQIRCGSFPPQCTDTNTDAENCGSCEQRCPNPQTCVEGRCK